MPFLLVRNDITKMEVDAIVNPSNTKLLKGDGTSTAVFEAAGELRLAAACRLAGKCNVGSAVITGGFKLPAKHIIHAVGPVWQGGDKGEESLLYNTYMNSLKLAMQKELESIAFPLLSSGSYGYPKNKALKVAVAAINDFLLDYNSDMMVYLVLYDKKSLSVSQKIFDSIDEYIDDNYVEEHPYRSHDMYQARRSRIFGAAEYRVQQTNRTIEIPQPAMMSAASESMDDTFQLMKRRLWLLMIS